MALRWSKKAVIVSVVLAAICMAYFRIWMMPVFHNTYDEWLTFNGEVISEPELLIDSQRFVVRSDSVDGGVQIKMPLYPRISVGDILELNCTLRQPEPFEGFRYDKYLERYHISSLCYYPGVKIVGHENSWQSQLYSVKKQMIHRFQHVLAPPEHTIILGAFFGLKRAIPENIMNDFRTTGTSHLLVISGLHVSLFTVIIMTTLQKFALSRRKVIVVVIITLLVYVLFTGVQPSAVRASIFGSVLLLSELLGRRNNSLRLLVLVGAIMLVINPLLLIYDAGWQLSFLATSGIIFFSKPINTRLAWLPNYFELRTVVSTTLAAIVSTSPIIAYNFHIFSPVAIFANLILVPVMPLVMTLGIIIVLCSLVSITITTWVSLPLYYLIHFMIKIVQWFADIPLASLAVDFIDVRCFFLLMIPQIIIGYRIIKRRSNEK